MNRAPFPYFGGKYRLLPNLKTYVSRDIECYLESFFGSGTLFFSSPQWATNEVINDLNGDIYNFFLVLRDKYTKLKHLIQYTPYDVQTFRVAKDIIKGKKSDEVHRAWALYVLMQMSVMANRKDFSRGNVGRNKPQEFINDKSRLDYCIARLQNATIENEDAIKVSRRYDGKTTFIYLDPPYLNVKNVASMRAAYHNHDGRTKEKTAEEMHAELIDWALSAKGYVLISNYHNPLYDNTLKNWHVEEIKIPTLSASGGRNKKASYTNSIEVLWSNEKCWKAKIDQPLLFEL